MFVIQYKLNYYHFLNVLYIHPIPSVQYNIKHDLYPLQLIILFIFLIDIILPKHEYSPRQLILPLKLYIFNQYPHT